MSPPGSASLTGDSHPQLAPQSKHLNEKETYNRSEILRLNTEKNQTAAENGIKAKLKPINF